MTVSFVTFHMKQGLMFHVNFFCKYSNSILFLTSIRFSIHGNKHPDFLIEHVLVRIKGNSSLYFKENNTAYHCPGGKPTLHGESSPNEEGEEGYGHC